MNNIIFSVTKQYMKRNRRRTAIAFMGIVLMVVMMTCVFVGKQTVLHYLDRVASLDKGSWHLIAHDLTADEAKQLGSLEETEQCGLSEQLWNMDFPQSGKPDLTPFIDVKSYSAESFAMNNITVSEGRLPENSSELILSKSVLDDGADIRIGDRISGDFFERTITGIAEGVESTFPYDNIVLHYNETVTVPIGFMPYQENDTYREDRVYTGISAEFTVVGFMESPKFEKRGSANYAALSRLDTLRTGHVNALVRLDTDKLNSIADFENRVNAFTASETKFETNELLLAFSAMTGDSNINTIIVFIEVFFTAFIMAASVILIYNVFNMSFAERTKYLGMLSSVGATRRQKRQSIYYESFALLLPALPIGILLGMLTVSGAMKLLKPRFDSMLAVVQFGMRKDVPATLSVGVPEICTIIVMCVLTVLISALIPAYKVSRIVPVESAKGAMEQGTKKHYRSGRKLLEAGKPELLLAKHSTSRCRHMTKGIIRSIAVFAVLTMVTLYGAQTVISIAEIKTGEGGVVPAFTGYDYCIAANTDSEFLENAKAVMEQAGTVTDSKEITQSVIDYHVDVKYVSESYWDAYKELFMQFDSHTDADWAEWKAHRDDWGEFINLVGVDDAEFAELSKNCGAEIYDASVPAALIYNECGFSTDYYRLGMECKGYKYVSVQDPLNIAQGAELPIIGSRKKTASAEPVEIPLKAAGFLDDAAVKGRFKVTPDAIWLFVNEAAAEKLYAETACTPYSVVLFAAEDETLVEKLSDLCEMSDGELYLSEYANMDMASTIKQVLTEIVRILAYCFTALISLVCLLNLYNSVRGRAAERTKETAVLRSIGMTEKQLNKMHDLENIMLLVRGFAIAAVLCTVLCMLLRHMIVSYFGNAQIAFPWLLTLGIMAVITAASVLMTRFCSRSRHTDLIEEIRRETV